MPSQELTSSHDGHRVTISFALLTQGYELKASIAFPALALFNLLRQPIRQMPECITSFINAQVAAGRLQDYIQVRHAEGR